MSIIDIIVFAAFAIFIFSRFSDGKMPKSSDIRSRCKTRKKQVRSVVDFPKSPDPEKDDGSIPGLAELKKKDVSFREKSFLNGSKKAYKFYYKKWNEKDDESLEKLLSPTLVNDAIIKFDKMDEKGITPKIIIEKIELVKIAEVRLNGQTAIISVKFSVMQSENMLDEKGKIVGKEKESKTVKTIWTMAKAVNSNDLNWEVESISKPN